MMTGQLLPFILNEDLYRHASKVVKKTRSAIEEVDLKLYDNVVDPFSAVFGSLVRGIETKRWFESERARQIQKTMENSLGIFHQDMLSSMPGWESSPEVVDIQNKGKKIIAEVKNKHNTTKGDHMKVIYDNLEGLLKKEEYRGYTGYYVEVIPKKPEPFDEPYTPSDNETHTRRPINERIRVIDGNSFYDMASGYEGALQMIYKVLPKVIGDILGKGTEGYMDGKLVELFERAYGQKKLL